MDNENEKTSGVSMDLESLRMHASGRPGKLEVRPTKPLITMRLLCLNAYQ